MGGGWLILMLGPICHGKVEGQSLRLSMPFDVAEQRSGGRCPRHGRTAGQGRRP